MDVFNYRLEALEEDVRELIKEREQSERITRKLLVSSLLASCGIIITLLGEILTRLHG